ncbi:hypothetical protein DM860_012780 [Cuscuta australis]|uniref:STL11/RBM22-like N-terminal domain-containing protein n=1 Tax=Cuscuta australis TaxID=267555 RepID=A0A328DUE7_9ASTE|nr:hypothetical protein DM860_012780 [Cuscuta australis]
MEDRVVRLREAIAESGSKSDHPILCEFCFGDNHPITEAPYDYFCKTCARPFTRFRWRLSRDGRYKKTEICKPCCVSGLVCQGCGVELSSLSPDQVRETTPHVATYDDVLDLGSTRNGET